MALWHHLRRIGLQRLIASYQDLNLFVLPSRSFAVPAHIRAKQQQDEEQHGPRLNEAITAERLRLVTDEGHNIVSRWEALDRAKRLNLDLVEVQRNPPVCKIMDFHKEKFKQVTKEKERTKSKALRSGENKEVRVNGKTELKDLKMKAETVIRLMERGYRVKCTALPLGREKDDVSPKTKAKDKSSARKSGREEYLLETNDEKEDLSAIETEEYWAKKKIKQEALLGTLTRLLSLMDDVAIVESGPHVIGARHAYIIVRHIKFEGKKSGKKGVKPLEALTNIQSSGPNKPVAVDNKNDTYQNEEWEIEESDSESDHVDMKKFEKPFVSKPEPKTKPPSAENKYAKESRQEVKIDSSVNENRYAKQKLHRTEGSSHPQVDPRQRQFNEGFSSPRPNASVNQFKSKPPIFSNRYDEHPAVNSGKLSAPKTIPAESTADENKKSSSPKKSYGIFSR